MKLKHKVMVIMNNAAYWQRVKNFGPIAYWPLWDAVGASSAVDLMGLGNGTPSNVTFGATGIGDGRTSGSFDGSTSYINIYSAALAALFSGTAGTIMLWFKISAAGVWTDGAARNAVTLAADVNNSVQIYKRAANNSASLLYTAGGTAKGATFSGSPTGWKHFSLTWDAAADEVIGYDNGAQIGAIQTGLGTWSGSLASPLCCIGASTTTPAQVMSGFVGHMALWTSALTATQIASLAKV